MNRLFLPSDVATTIQLEDNQWIKPNRVSIACKGLVVVETNDDETGDVVIKIYDRKMQPINFESWLAENVGEPWTNWGWFIEERATTNAASPANMYASKICFCFDVHDHAMLFKLTWGGQ